MSIRRAGDGTILLEEACPVEEAETLLALLAARPDAPVDWSGAGRLHTAVVQVLLASRARPRGVPRDPFAARWLAPVLSGG